jgi:hypothetical protein
MIFDLLVAEHAVPRQQLEQAHPRSVRVARKVVPAAHAASLRASVTRHVEIGAVGEDQLVIRAGAIDRLGDVVGDGDQQLLILAQLGFGALAFGDVAGDGEQERVRIATADQREHDLDGELRAVKAIDHPLEAMAAAFEGELDDFFDALGGARTIRLVFRAR